MGTTVYVVNEKRYECRIAKSKKGLKILIIAVSQTFNTWEIGIAKSINFSDRISASL